MGNYVSFGYSFWVSVLSLRPQGLSAAPKELTVKVSKKDKYGRSIGKISTPEIKDVGLEMIKAGLAWQYRDYNKDESYAEAERLARENKKGLWVYKNPVRPQDFRKQNRNKNK